MLLEYLAHRVPHAVHGTIAALSASATGPDRDIYVSSPDPMMTTTAEALLAAFTPRELLRYELSAVP